MPMYAENLSLEDSMNTSCIVLLIMTCILSKKCCVKERMKFM